MTQRIFGRMDRRSAVKWMLAALGSMQGGFAGSITMAAESPAGTLSESNGAGYGKDPDLLRSYGPGEIWPLTMTAQQRETALALCDLMLPAEGSDPSASTVGVPDFIDEWISAPYAVCRVDRDVILDGLDWLDAEAQKRHRLAAAALEAAVFSKLCEALSDPQQQGDADAGEGFFGRFRKLVAVGYFTTPVGMQSLGYVGNRASATFEGPSPTVLRQAGVDT